MCEGLSTWLPVLIGVPRGCSDAPAPDQLHPSCPGASLPPALLGSESQLQESIPLFFDPQACQAHPLTKSTQGKGWDCKNVQYLGLQRKSLWFCPVLRAHGCPWAAVSIPAEPGDDHTLEDSQERRFPPVGFSQCVDFDFCILCGLSPI